MTIGPGGPGIASETGDGDVVLLDSGRARLAAGDAQGAVKLLEAALEQPDGDSLDLRLVLAEALWQQAGPAGTDRALPHYEAALAFAQKAGDTSKEGMVALGHGFALAQLGRATAARERLLHAEVLAKSDGNEGAARFARQMLERVGSEMSAPQEAWEQLVKAAAASNPLVLFMRGSLDAPADHASLKGCSLLRAAGCGTLEVIDVSADGPGVARIADLSDLTFPQLWVGGVELKGWLDLPPAKLRERLAAAGIELGDEPAPEPCHGGSALADGLASWEARLVELVAQEGLGSWEGKHAQLAQLPASDTDRSPLPAGGAALEAAWLKLAPAVRERLEHQPEMPCGHSCSTCPTRHDCQLHDAVGAPIRDIEDIR